MTNALAERDRMVFRLEAMHKAEAESRNKELTALRERNIMLTEKLKATENEVTTLAAERQEDQVTIARQQEQIGKIKPTMFGAFIGGTATGVVFATILTTYTLWASGALQ